MKNLKLMPVLLLIGRLAACGGATDETTLSPTIGSTIFWTVAGLATLGIGVFMPQLNRLMGMPSQEEQFTVPKFKRTAELNGRISRAVLIFLGLGMIVNGLGPHLLAHSLTRSIAYVLLALAFLGILLMVVITTGNWRA